jgi:hypothetical protein
MMSQAHSHQCGDLIVYNLPRTTVVLGVEIIGIKEAFFLFSFPLASLLGTREQNHCEFEPDIYHNK